MKIFKKAISLVLVFAMLASFAGMTGYKYSPMSIEAEAKHFKTAGGVEITMWSTIYKINHDYTMTYPDKSDSSVSHTSEDGDYAIPHFDEANNLSYSLVFPEGTTQFNAGCSIDGVYWTSYGTLTSTENPSYWSSGKAVMNRPGNDAMYWDYGALYRDNLLGKGVKGFRDIGKIKWRVVYTCNGTEYTEYWTVDVLDWDRQSAGNSQAWNGAATSSKPTDSHAGKNALTNLHVPATLYLNGTSVVQSMNSRRGDPRRFDTFAMFTVPSGAYDVTIYQVDIDDNPIKNQLTFSKPDGTGAAATGTASNAGVSGNTYKWNLAGTASAGEVYYRIEYKMDVTDINGNPDTITYIQYAASYAKTMPNYNAVWAIVDINEGNGRAEAKTKFSFVHEMGFLQAFMVSGVNVNVTASGLSANYNGSWNWYDHASGTNALGFQQDPSQSNKGDIRWTGGATGTTSTSNSMGADIYYDAQAKTANASNYDLINTTASSIGMDMYLMHYKDGNDSGQTNYKWCRTDSYGEKWSAYAAGWSYTASSTTYGDDNPKNKLTNVYSGTTYTEYSKGIDPDDGLGSGTQEPTQTSYYNYTLSNLGSIPSLRCAVHASGESRNSYFGTYYYHYVAYGWHVNMHSVDRTEPHTLIEAARKNNYVKQEMDATWWNAYRKAVFAAYVNCGNLQTGEQISYVYDNVTIDVNISKPVYKFADYSALNTSILTPVEWDRGGKVGSGTEPAAGYLDWGTGYEKWNSKTYATDYGKVTDEDNNVYLAAYDLVFTEDTEAETMEFKVSNTPRTGAYYYTADTWNAYTAARDYAVEVYNYPNSTVAKFDYDTAYPAKAATQEGNQANVGLACYHQAEIDAAVSNLQTKRDALVKYDVKNNNYDIDQYYRKLVNQLGTIAYDESAKALFDFNTKHGFAGITSEIYDEATIVFRASAPEDVFDYVWKVSESSDPDYLGDGHVKVDADGNPLAIDDNGTPDDTSDDKVVLASQVGDVGILEFPRADGTLRPVGRGNTFSQLYFDNSAKSQYAVTSARAALRNRLRWYMGGGGAAGYEYLGMVEGVYNQQGLTEDDLNNNPTQYFWSGKEHQDDILREVYALYRVKTTLRLAANYREVVEVLNNENNYIPSYDIGGTAYKEKNLQNETMFQTYTPASAWDTVSITANGATYHTSGKTWYTEDSWAGFIADRNKLAAMIYNGSTRTSTSSPYGDASEIGQDYIYDSGVANKYYTYDVKLSSGVSITNKYYTNGYYQDGGNLAAEYQDDINQAVKDYKAWFNGDTTDGKELKLKDLDAYTWKAYNETTVSSIEQKVASLYKEIDTTQAFVDFVPATKDGKLSGATLNPTTIKLYTQADIDELNALADYVTALHESTTAEAVYKGDDSLADNAVAFDNALDAFNTKYLAIKNGGSQVDKSSWDDIFDHLTTLAGGTEIDEQTILSTFTTLYNDVNLDTNNQGDVYKAINSALTLYKNAKTQSEVNDAVTALYNALSTQLTSVEVGKAADAAIAYPKNLTFNVYNYTMDKQDGSHETPSQFTADSVAELETAATAAKTHSYNMLGTYTSSLTAKATEVTALKNLKSDNNGGVLVYTGAVTTYLEQAIAYAESELYSDVANQVVKTTRVTNPAGTEYKDVPLYSEQSVAELKVTLTEAKAALAKAKSGEYGWTDQIELDKYTFLVYDETAPDTGDNAAAYLLAKGIVNDAAYGSPYEWSTVAEDGTVTKEDLWESAANGYYAEGLYGNRLKAQTGMVDAGLQSGPAYYGFLEAEYEATTVVKTNDDGTTTTTDYEDIVWKGDGTLVYTANNVAVGATTFNNWSSYMEYYDKYATLDKNLTIDSQSTIDTLASDIYRTRNALTLNYFPSNQEGFAEATKLFNQLKAYETATTPITRYGYAADADGNVIYENGELVKGEPTDSAKQLVALYSDIPAEFIAEVAEFEAKYANMNSTEPYNSWEEGKVQDLYNRIYNTYLNPETAGDNLITAKAADHDDFKAGFNDLVENYIAGDWTNGAYTSDLLNSTQVTELGTALTNAEAVFTGTENVTKEYGATVTAQTDIVFNYTKNPATYLQFAEAMKSQVEGFMNMTFDIQLPTFYNGGNTVTAPVFDQKMVAQYKNDIETFYEQTYEWPAIYQIHGLDVQKSTATNTKDNYFVVQYPNSGEPYATNTLKNGSTTINNAATSYTNLVPKTDDAVDNKIYELFTELGGKSHYYTDILDYPNSYHTASLAWIVNNAIGKTIEIGDDPAVAVILADLNSNVNGNEGSKITVEDAQLTAINNANVSVDQWEKVMIDVNYDVRTTSSWYTEGYGETVDGRVYYNYSWFDSTIDTLESKLTTAQTQIKNQFKITDYNETTQLIVPTAPAAQVTKIKDECWTSTRGSTLSTTITAAQNNIKNQAQYIYNAILGLKLLPATEAYRDVYNTYLSVKGQHIADWLEGSFCHAKTDENDKEIIDAVDYTYYNMDPNFIGKTNLSKEKGEYTTYDTTPPYGVVFRSSNYNLWGKYKQAGEYVGTDHMAALDEFINDLIDKGAVITIDQAAKVNTYGEIDGERTIKKILIDDYLSQLQLTDFVFTNLDMVIKAFLGNRLQADLVDNMDNAKILNEELKLPVNSSYGRFYDLSFYTDASLLEVAKGLRQANVLKDDVVKFDTALNSYIWTKNPVTETIYYNEEMWGSFYTSVSVQTQIDGNESSVLKNLIEDLNTKLVLKDVDTDGYKNSAGVDIPGIEAAISSANDILTNKAKYDQTHSSWIAFEDEWKKATALLGDADKYNITHQTQFDQQTSDLFTAIENLKDALIADNYAPSMTLKTSVSAVKDFYGKEAYAVALSKADSVSYTVTEADGKTNYDAHPEAGTFFVPNSSGYSLIVYTNELNPRIVINLEDLEQNLNADSAGAPIYQDAAKQEYIAIKAKRTSGVTTNVIAGTIIPAQGSTAEQLQIIGQTDAATGAVEATANNEVTVTNGSNVKGSSAFAILAPIFKSDKTTQAAVYTIEARDGSARSVEGGEILGNPANKFDFGTEQEPIGITVYDTTNSTPRISIYVYYYGLKAEDGTEEGINTDGSALAAPAISGTHVPSALLSGEPGFKGTDWRNGILLQRHFSDSHRVWEYVSEIKQNEKKQYNVNGTQVPLYNDPTFGQLNTGSFYYVLDESVAADADVIAAYNNSNNAVAGCMDYDRATAAKDLMISKINEKDSTVFAAMKKSGRLYNYGDYYTDEYGNVLYNGSEPQWINWAQSLNNKVENGSLVFVHVVDRWGNVVNRIVEITNLDKKAPQVNSATSGEVSINEAGGSGIKDITVHNGDFSLGKFDYEINQSQKLTNGQVANNATVESADDTLTIKGLVPGKLYYIGAYDNAGNAGSTPVNASSEGKITLTIKVEDDRVETGEENGVTPNSTTFTLNGTDTIILNSGEASSVINADIEGNVFANRLIKHLITTLDTVTGLKTVYQDGTVEEWTSSNARVKDNGDGTLTWTIGRNFAEGEHNYKVYAKVDGEYEKFYAPANFFATNKSVRITYRVSGPGNTVLVYGGASGINNPNYNSLTVPYGSKVTITAETNIEGCEFYYWINNTTDRIISTANVLEFKAVANVDYIAQFTNNSTYTDGKKFVVYVNNAKNVIERFELADGDSYTVPTGPVLPDYTFMGWSMTKAEVLESDKDTIIVEPIYELNASNTVTITQGNYTATGAGTYTAQDNQRAVVTISTSAKDGDGKEFLYWLDADTDEIISYDRTYSFFCVKDTELTPVYGDASTITAEPIVRITEVKFNALSGKVSFFAERSVPEEFVILQTGIVVTKTESIGTNEEVFVVGGTSTAAGTSTSTANNGYYSANTAVATGQTVWARAYVIYETADGEIFEAYGPVVSYTVD